MDGNKYFYFDYINNTLRLSTFVDFLLCNRLLILLFYIIRNSKCYNMMQHSPSQSVIVPYLCIKLSITFTWHITLINVHVYVLQFHPWYYVSEYWGDSSLVLGCKRFCKHSMQENISNAFLTSSGWNCLTGEDRSANCWWTMKPNIRIAWTAYFYRSWLQTKPFLVLEWYIIVSNCIY